MISIHQSLLHKITPLVNKTPRVANHHTAPSIYPYSSATHLACTALGYPLRHLSSTKIVINSLTKTKNLTSSGKIFLPVLKAGLSILTTKSTLLKNGFLNGILFPLPWGILYGPFGCGKVLFPYSMHWYSPASGEEMISKALDSAKVDGSNSISTETSIPS